MNRSIVELAVWAAIIVAVTLLGRWAFSVDTHAQEGGGSTPTVTPTTLGDVGQEGEEDEEEKRENAPNCEEPFNASHPSCRGYVTMADRTATAVAANKTATAEARRTATAEARRTATVVAKTATKIARDQTATALSMNKTATVQSRRETATAISDRKTATAGATITAVVATVTAWAEVDVTVTPISSKPPSDGNGPRPTPTPTPTPRPGGPITSPVVPPPPAGNLLAAQFGATVRLGAQHITANDAGFRFDINDVAGFVSIDIVQNDMNISVGDYEFRFESNPSHTGYYIIRNHDEDCGLANQGDEATSWSTNTGPVVRLIRCGLGESGNTGFHVLARRLGTVNGTVIHQTGEITQALHRDGQTTFYQDLDYPEGAKTNYASLGHYKPTVIARAVAEGKNGVDRAVIGLSPLREVTTDDAHVTIKAFWRDGGTPRTCSVDAVACYYMTNTYPHLNDDNLWITVPPVAFDPVTFPMESEWTDSSAVSTDPMTNGRYFFLPNILAHEFGHALGLKHLSRVEAHIMSEYTKMYEWAGPSTGDLNGFREVANPH